MQSASRRLNNQLITEQRISHEEAKEIDIHTKAQRGDVASVRKWLTTGNDINTLDKRGLTLLHTACIRCGEAMVSLLLENDVDITICDPGGYSALHWCASEDSHELISALMKGSADINSTTVDKRYKILLIFVLFFLLKVIEFQILGKKKRCHFGLCVWFASV